MSARVVETEVEEVRERTWMEKLIALIYYLTGLVNVLLLLRLIFKAFGANPGSGIVSLVYAVTETLLLPFWGIFPPAVAGESVVEPAILVAMLIYSLLARAIVELIRITSNE